MTVNSAIRPVLETLLRAVVRLMLRRGLVFKDAALMLKGVFIQVASEELERSGAPATTTRISAITGLNRNEVSMRKTKPPEVASTGFVARILGAWEADRRFSTVKGSPKPLAFRGRGNPFALLVKTASSHLNARAALLELVRSGHARIEGKTVYRLMDVQTLNKDAIQTLDLAARDCATILEAAQANLLHGRSEHVHMRTEYDNVYAEDLPRIREWVARESRELHKRLRELLSECDKDLNPHREVSSTAGARAVYGSFSWVE